MLSTPSGENVLPFVSIYWVAFYNIFIFNPFFPNTFFLYLLRTSENLTVFWCFHCVEKGCIGNKWVNAYYATDLFLYPLKICFLMFRGYRKRPVTWNGVSNQEASVYIWRFYFCWSFEELKRVWIAEKYFVN